MTLLTLVLGRLGEHGISCALIGAEAMAIRGVSRATLDQDLLVTDRRALASATWAGFDSPGIRFEVRRGDDDDPLAGVVRFAAAEERPVDIIVGRYGWQTGILQRAVAFDLGEVSVTVPTTSDLILLKLFAGGSQDAWDVTQLLNSQDRAGLVGEVQARLAELPEDCRGLWEKILRG